MASENKICVGIMVHQAPKDRDRGWATRPDAYRRKLRMQYGKILYHGGAILRYSTQEEEKIQAEKGRHVERSLGCITGEQAETVWASNPGGQIGKQARQAEPIRDN